MSSGGTIIQPILNSCIVNSMQSNNNSPPEEEEEEEHDTSLTTAGGSNGSHHHGVGGAVARTPQRTNSSSNHLHNNSNHNHNNTTTNNNNNSNINSSLAHDPISTPIASAKRPRGAPGGAAGAAMLMTTSTTAAGLASPPLVTSTTTMTPDIDYTQLSPMHAVKPVHREALEDEIKDIFSPVAHFLHDVHVNNPFHNSNHIEGGSENNDTTAAEDDDNDDSSSIDQDESIAQPPLGDDDEFNPWTFIQTLPPYESLSPNPVTLPPAVDNTKKCLVLDLDETLVHCSVEAPAPHAVPADLTFPVMFHGNHYTVHVKLRPWLQNFLESVSTKFEVIVFTASQKVYADALLNLIDPEGKYIHHRLFRESCLQVEGNFLKDLNVLGRPLATTLLVDNSPHAFGYQVDNGIPIESWFDDPNDRELRKLEKFLVHKILDEPDVRPVIRRKFQSRQLVQESSC